MLIFLKTSSASLSSVFRSRVTLELENLALRHQIGTFIAPRENDRSYPKRIACFGSACPQHLAQLALGARHHQTRNGRGLASCQLSLVLELEVAPRPNRDDRSFPATFEA